MPAPKLPPGAPWKPPEWGVADAAAVQALARGDATPAQQQRALAWIVEGACGTYDLSWRPNDPHWTSFAEGRRFVGLELVKLTRMNLAAMRKVPNG
ncbi:MAG TPA: hypothetical protein VFJ13_05745 [Paracoccaceae bacterium]|nr:hypothetical protein [Paracoccaceae bacterium]